MGRNIEIYDVTLRDGAQGPGIKFSSEDQLRVVQALDDFGVRYIEGGQPGSNPKAAIIEARPASEKYQLPKLRIGRTDAKSSLGKIPFCAPPATPGSPSGADGAGASCERGVLTQAV